MHDARLSLSNTDVDECATDSGGCAQNCHNTVGSYYCSCDDGYTLNEDGHSCDGTLLFKILLYTDIASDQLVGMLSKDAITCIHVITAKT